jgi:hypothetical protein
MVNSKNLKKEKAIVEEALKRKSKIVLKTKLRTQLEERKKNKKYRTCPTKTNL